MQMVPHLYCIGDANGKMMLAHAASAQSEIAATSFLKSSQSFVFHMSILNRHGMLCPMELVLGRSVKTLIMLLALQQQEKMFFINGGSGRDLLVKETFGYYLKSSGHGSEANDVAATEKWGQNVFQSWVGEMRRSCQ